MDFITSVKHISRFVHATKSVEICISQKNKLMINTRSSDTTLFAGDEASYIRSIEFHRLHCEGWRECGKSP